MSTAADIYAAAREAVRLQCLLEEAENTVRRLRIEYANAVRAVVDMAVQAGEQPEPEKPAERDLFSEVPA